MKDKVLGALAMGALVGGVLVVAGPAAQAAASSVCIYEFNVVDDTGELVPFEGEGALVCYVRDANGRCSSYDSYGGVRHGVGCPPELEVSWS